MNEGEIYVNTLVAGQDQTVGFKVRNSGTNVSLATYASVPWILDNTANSWSGQLASSAAVPNIENGTAQRLTLNLAVPSTPGRYFACISADENRAAGQTNYAHDVTFAGPFDVIATGPEILLSETFSVIDNSALPSGVVTS